MGQSEAWMSPRDLPRVPDKLQRASDAAQSRDPEATRHDADGWAPALQRTTPDDAPHRRAAALRPGHESGVWGMFSPRHCERSEAIQTASAEGLWIASSHLRKIAYAILSLSSSQ